MRGGVRGQGKGKGSELRCTGSPLARGGFWGECFRPSVRQGMLFFRFMLQQQKHDYMEPQGVLLCIEALAALCTESNVETMPAPVTMHWAATALNSTQIYRERTCTARRRPWRPRCWRVCAPERCYWWPAPRPQCAALACAAAMHALYARAPLAQERSYLHTHTRARSLHVFQLRATTAKYKLCTAGGHTHTYTHEPHCRYG